MHLEAKFLVSQRRACAVSGQHRSTQRRLKVESTKEDELLCHIEELVREHPRYGYRRITSLLRMEGWQINKKRVHRIWKERGYRVNPARRKRHAEGGVQNACNKRKAGFRNDVWSYDFIFDRLENGKPIKILAITDEYTRTSISLEAASSLTGSKVVEILNCAVAAHGLPCCIRSDNGSEFTGKAMRKWFEATGVTSLKVAAGSPWQNGYAESFNSRFRDECLNMHQFYTIDEARILIRQWQRDYNEKRPHSALSGMTPSEFSKRSIVAGMVPTSDERLNGPFSVGPVPALSKTLI